MVKPRMLILHQNSRIIQDFVITRECQATAVIEKSLDGQVAR